MNDILKDLIDSGFKPVENEESTGFAPITGKYICTIKEAGLKEGVSKKSGNTYAFRAIKLVIAEVIEGDKAVNRHLDLSYNLDAEGIKKLLNDLFTAGMDVSTITNEAMLNEFLLGIADKVINVRCWVWTPDKTKDGAVIPEDQRVGRQQVKIVKDFTKSKSSGKKSSDVPF